MVVITNIILLGISITALIVPRSAFSIIFGIATIELNVKSLTSTVNGYNGVSFVAIPVQNDESTLDSPIKSATSNASSNSQLSSAGTQTILASIQNSIPDIEVFLAALKS